MRTLGLVVLGSLAAVGAAGCGGSDEKHPSLAITGPAAGAEVPLGTDAGKSVAIMINLQNFTLKAPGDCKETADCGHLHINIDGDACNEMAKPYNGAATDATMVTAKFALCAMDKQVGEHKVTVSAHDDAHAAILHDGAAISASVTFKTK